ncbi:hypothetical protein Enr10x_47000 [Gimesia panareensis]|uniref:Uncharacterized protein n=1 Tax=Gimesia panareensis TaxID=2527978 RepID=A0A517QCJ6_9PLAN|nr:hypothetical protein [Gimesia panareensis]QDT29348.1 hypothetical protein Enr10x_47000 [Gimesia panareensis]
MRADSRRKFPNSILKVIGLSLIPVVAMSAVLLWLVSLPRESDFHFDLGQGRALDIYCEGEFFYEPPGYVSYQITENGKVLVPERDFCGIGSQRVPSGRLEVLSTRDGETIAFRRNFNVMIMHDFKTNRSWPDENGQVKWDDFLLAIELLQRFKAEGQDLYSDLIDRYLNIYLSSPNEKLNVNQVWNAQGDQAELLVRVSDRHGGKAQLLLPREKITVPLSEEFDWHSGWGAGWLSNHRFGVWVTGAGVRVWDLSDDGMGKELPGPLDAELVEEVKSFPAHRFESQRFSL